MLPCQSSPSKTLFFHRRNLSYCKCTLDIHTQIVTYLRPQELRYILTPGNHVLTKSILESIYREAFACYLWRELGGGVRQGRVDPLIRTNLNSLLTKYALFKIWLKLTQLFCRRIRKCQKFKRRTGVAELRWAKNQLHVFTHW